MRIASAHLLPVALLLARFGLAPSLAQTPAPPELIDRLVANATLYSSTLPSITANEAIDSETSYLIFHRRVATKGIFRVVRNPATDELEESRQVTEVDGKPLAPGQHAGLPWTMSGGFGKFQEIFFTPEHRLCYSFTLMPKPGPGDTEQINIAELPPGERSAACMASSRSFTGMARVDPATSHVVYFERSTSEEMTRKYGLAPFASVEAAPAKIGDETFWLPTVVVGTYVNGKQKGRFTAHYSNFHRYTGSITILPGVREVEGQMEPKPETAPAKPPPP